MAYNSFFFGEERSITVTSCLWGLETCSATLKNFEGHGQLVLHQLLWQQIQTKEC